MLNRVLGKQRWVHYYFVNELLVSLVGLRVLRSRGLLPALVSVISTSTLLTALVAALVFLRVKLKRTPLVTKARHPLPKWIASTIKTRDGIELKLQIAKSESKKVMLLAAPLGQCGPSIYDPILSYYGAEYTYVTWDYRGFFNSSTPDKLRRISVPEHAQDAKEVLEAAGFSKADVMIGHSMGTVVTLETVLLFPEMVDTIVLLNGFHGQVFRTAFQLIFRIPFMGDAVAWFIDFNVNHPKYIELTFGKIMLPLFRKVMPKHYGVAKRVACRGTRTFLSAALCSKSSKEEAICSRHS